MAAYGFDEHKNKVLVAGAEDFGDKTNQMITFPNGKVVAATSWLNCFTNIPANGTEEYTLIVPRNMMTSIQSVVATPMYKLEPKPVIINAAIATSSDGASWHVVLTARNLGSEAITSYGCSVMVVGFSS